MKTKAVRLYGVNDLRLEEFELPPIAEDEILVKIISDSICMSSHKAALQGAAHKRVPDDIAVNPTIIGHEFCGVIVEVGKKWQDKYKAGDGFSIQPPHNKNGSLYAPCMRVYTNDDVLGVEICGALKNIIALASGIAIGLGCGDNAKAALITRGIAEISRLGLAMGCREQTFGGLAGIGDLIVTATSKHSRNLRCGMLLGQGVPVDEATKQVGMVVEGLNALPAALALSKKHGIEMPIIDTVDAVVSGRVSISDAIRTLMSRDLKSELTGSSFDNRYD